MAQNYLNTGTAIGNREDLSNLLRDANYKKTPLLKICGTGEATAILHEWVEDALDIGRTDTNTRAEGFTTTSIFASGNNTVRIRRSNNCEIIARPFSVSRTQNKVDKAGVPGKEYDKQLERKTKELSLDLNATLWNQVGVTRVADSGTAAEMDGYFAVATINNADAGGVVLTEDIYTEFLQQLVEAGVDPDIVFCAGKNKRVISSWAAPFRRYDNGQTTVKNSVMEYDGDWGVQSIVFDKDVPTTRIAVTQKDMLKVAYLDPFVHVRKSGESSAIDGEQGYVLTEATFEYGARKCIGQISNIG